MSDDALRRRAAAFADAAIAPGAAERDGARAPLPRDAYRRYAAEGFAALQVAPGLGGGGATLAQRLIVAETMARRCFASAFALNNLGSPALLLSRVGTPEQVAHYLPRLLTAEWIAAPAISEPGAGSDAAALATRATAADGGWRIDGEKAWVTNGVHADLLLVYARVGGEPGADGIASFLVEAAAAGVRRGAPERLAGGSAIGAAPFSFAGAPATMLAPPGRAFRLAMGSITAARVLVAAMVNGGVADSLASALAVAGERSAFGRRLLEHQGLRWSLADVSTWLEASRALAARAAGAIDGGEAAVLEAAQAKAFATEGAGAAIAACQAAAGAAGLRDEAPFGRHAAGARIAAVVDGTLAMQRERIGALLPGRYLA